MTSNRALVDDLREAIGQALEAGDSMHGIARRAQTTAGQVSRLFRGERQPSLDIATRIAKALGNELVLRRRRK